MGSTSVGGRQGAHVVFAPRAGSGLRVDVSGGELEVTKKFLHLVDGHQARVEQDGGNRVAQQIRVDALGDPRLPAKRSTTVCTVRRVEGMTVALKKVTLPTALKVGAQLLRQGGQHRHVTAGLSFGVRQIDLG